MSNVVQFPGARQGEHAPPTVTTTTIIKRRRPQTEPQTETGRNLRLREQRAEVWRKAEIATRYWQAKIDFDDAWIAAAKHGIAPSPGLYDVDARSLNVRKWREA